MEQPITIEEYKKIEIDMLYDIDNFCLKNGITYCVMYGTLIGTIRHGGFIPWDDDIDIAMPRKDYIRFLNEYQSECYKILNNAQSSYYYPFAKVVDSRTRAVEPHKKQSISELGVWIDIFPMDKISKRNLTFNYFFSHLLNRMLYYSKRSVSEGGKGDKVLWKISRCIGFDAISSLHMTYTNNLNKIKREFCFCPCGVYGKREILDCGYFNSMERMKFENIEVSVPTGYDNVLKSIYGDYMTLPPENERMAKHGAEFWLRE